MERFGSRCTSSDESKPARVTVSWELNGPVNRLINRAFLNVAEKDIPTFVATINPRVNYGYWCQLVARIVPKSPNPLTQRAKTINTHVHKQDAGLAAHRSDSGSKEGEE
jgi:hypothetical protein